MAANLDQPSATQSKRARGHSAMVSLSLLEWIGKIDEITKIRGGENQHALGQGWDDQAVMGLIMNGMG